MRLVASFCQFGVELVTSGVGNDLTAEHHGVAGKSCRFIRRYGDQFRDELLENGTSVFVKCVWVVDGFSDGKRAKAGVDVVIFGVNKFKRNDPYSQADADFLHGFCVTAHAVPRVQRVITKECVTGAFKRGVLQWVEDGVSVRRKPLAEIGFLSLPLWVFKAGYDSLPAVDQGGVGGEDQVGQSLGRLQQRDAGAKVL